MTGFLSTFSKPFQLAVLLWPFVSVLLTVPAAVYLYHRDNRLRPVSVLGAYAFMLYVLGLGCFTLYPWPQDPAAYCATHHLGAQLNPLQFIGDIRTDGVTAILQLGMNIVLFVPMGFFLARFFRLPSWVAVAVCCATSVCIEVAQLTGLFHLYPCAYRICDVDDVITHQYTRRRRWRGAGPVVQPRIPHTAHRQDGGDHAPGVPAPVRLVHRGHGHCLDVPDAVDCAVVVSRAWNNRP